MSTQVQWRRGNNGQIAAFTGADGEITVNTTNYTLSVHDGTTAGGFELVGTTATQSLSNKTLSGNTTVSGNLIPGANITYSLGTTTARFKDLWLAGNTIYLDNSNISVVNGNIVFYTSAGTVDVNLLNVNSTGLSANLGAYQIYANSNAASQSVAINNVDANIGAYQTYANSKIGTNTNSNLVVQATTESVNTTTGALVVKGGAGIQGNLFVNGNIYTSNLISIAASTLSVQDPLLYLTANTTTPYNYDIGFYSQFTGGSGNFYQHTGLVRDFSAYRWKLFSNVQSEPGTTINWSDAGLIYDSLQLGALTVSNTTVSTSNTTGALVVSGGVGIAGNVYTAGYIIPQSNTSQNLGTVNNWWGTFYGVSTQARYADLAEIYSSDADYAPGTVVVFGGAHEVTISTNSHDTAVAGVVSTNPAYLMNSAATGVAVALTGRVPCRVQGPVNKGSVLVTGAIPGVAQALIYAHYQPGSVLGKSLEAIPDTSVQTIEIVVGRF
jgi:hypothetical protein